MDFRSPKRQMATSHYNYGSGLGQQYEEEFWKLKAQRLEGTIEELKQDNLRVNKRVVELSRVQQELRQAIAIYEDDWKKRSRRLTAQRASDKFQEVYEDKLTSKAELERLYKEIRVIKNTHDVQLSRLVEENKKLRKQVEDSKETQDIAKINGENLKIISKLNDDIKQIKKKVSSGEETIGRLREEKSKLMGDVQQYRREVQEIKMKQKIAEKQEEQKLMDYKKRNEELVDLKISQKVSKVETIMEKDQQEAEEIEENTGDNVDVPLLPQIGGIAMSLNFDHERQQLTRLLKDSKDEYEQLKRKIKNYEQKMVDYQNKVKMLSGERENERFSGQVRVKRLEGELMELHTQLSDVLRKLSPLLDKKGDLAHIPENADKRASLSILQIFLKKYKIKAF